MQTLFNVKNKIREVIRKYQEIIFPILRLIWCYLVFSNVHTMFHYMDLFDRKLVIFLVSVLCAVLPDPFMVFVAGAIITPCVALIIVFAHKRNYRRSQKLVKVAMFAGLVALLVSC